ncbi:putative O-linked N-acetylglucosamine transferase (SPINDLY family) [Deinococcus yavapaiensis KR-236]|uniref:protein O-GlcNAc transferase n=2 Tax=Deinococcus TaxID=1298 RepID=A0A318S4W5_9DEIO|nr:putative O-linked N-acetylglucosamine transferase (SPINDLY family) [Deinococcus yavapaiensis KR-236]
MLDLHRRKQHDALLERGQALLVERPDEVQARLLVAQVFAERGQWGSVEEVTREGLRLDAKQPDLLRYLGAAVMNQGRVAQAAGILQEALQVQPSPQTAVNFAIALLQLGHEADGLRVFQYAASLAKNDAERARILSFAATQLFARDLLGGAATLSEALRRLQPADPVGWTVYAVALFKLGRFSEAVEVCLEGLSHHPTHPDLHVTLADALLEAGRHDEAKGAAEEAERHLPPERRASWRLHRALSLPVVADAASEIDEARAFLRATLDELRERVREGEKLLPLVAVGGPPFMLAYHGQDNLALRRDLAALLREASPELTYTAPHVTAPRAPGKIRVGFLSFMWGNSSPTKQWLGLIQNLDRERFHVTVLALGPLRQPDSPVARALLEAADEFVMLPRQLEQAREIVAQRALDVLQYAEPNADALEYLLAFARLARVQGTSISYPETTGIDTMDDFVSTPEMDPDGFEAQYSERLVRLPGTATLTHYVEQTPPSRKTRADLGLPEGRLYACPQALFKFHPDIDALFETLLRRDPEGHLVLIQGENASQSEKLLERLGHNLGDACARVVMLPRLSGDDYNRVLQLVDVVLDPPYYTGYTTSIAALTMGTPVVTREGRFNRERHTGAMLRAVEADACVVPDLDAYVERAVELAHPTVRRAFTRATISKNAHRLTLEKATVRAFEAYFEEVVRSIDAQGRRA